MKRGLKVIQQTNARLTQIVEESSPMKRGLKEQEDVEQNANREWLKSLPR